MTSPAYVGWEARGRCTGEEATSRQTRSLCTRAVSIMESATSENKLESRIGGVCGSDASTDPAGQEGCRRQDLEGGSTELSSSTGRLGCVLWDEEWQGTELRQCEAQRHLASVKEKRKTGRRVYVSCLAEYP